MLKDPDIHQDRIQHDGNNIRTAHGTTIKRHPEPRGYVTLNSFQGLLLRYFEHEQYKMLKRVQHDVRRMSSLSDKGRNDVENRFWIDKE